MSTKAQREAEEAERAAVVTRLEARHDELTALLWDDRTDEQKAGLRELLDLNKAELAVVRG